MTNLITTLPRYGAPGSIVDTRSPVILPVRYVTNLVAQQYTLDLNPISGAISNLGTYTLSTRGSQSSLVFRQGLGSNILDLTSQLVAHINRFGYLWASIQSSGVIKLASREAGVDNQVLLMGGLFGATLTQTVAPSNPPSLMAGTVVAWDRTYNPSDPWASNKVTNLADAIAVPGFVSNRDIAGVIVRSNLNYSDSDQVKGTELEIMRNGSIWVRNYGTTDINRSSITAINSVAATSSIPSGAFGNSFGLIFNQPMNMQYQSIARPNETAILNINLA